MYPLALVFCSCVALALMLNLALWIWVWLFPILVKPVGRLPYGAPGLALPGIILLTHPDNAFVLRHELAHIAQFRRYSPLGAHLLIAWHYGRHALSTRRRTGHWPSKLELWSANPLEIAANQQACTGHPSPIQVRLLSKSR